MQEISELERSLWKLNENFSVVSVDIDNSSLFIQTASCQLYKLPLALTFVGLGYAPYLPWMDPKEFPVMYGLHPQTHENGKTVYFYKDGYFTMYVPEGKKFYITSLDDFNVRLMFFKEQMKPSARDEYLKQLCEVEFAGDRLRGYKIGDNVYQDPTTSMCFTINKNMTPCQ